MTTQETLSWFHGNDKHQRILNARPIPPMNRQEVLRPIADVRARIEWERDGEEYIDSSAEYWSRADESSTILVEILDPRYALLGVWLDVSDVQRLDS